jgi:peroxiredoxin
MQFRFAFIYLTIFAAACGDSARSEPARTRTPTSTDANGAVQLGSVPAPALDGQDSGGGTFSLRKLKGNAVVLVFYRGAFCGLCREQLKQIAAKNSEFKDADAKVVGVTLDSPDVAKKTKEDLKLDIPIVSAKPETFRAWGLWDQGERWPHSGTFVLDAAGNVRSGRVATTATPAMGNAELLQVAHTLAGSR